MRKPLIAGNWKMNQSRESVPTYFSELSRLLGMPWSQVTQKVDVLFAVPFTLLDLCQKQLAGTDVMICAQNIHEEASGAYTGEISASMLKEAGVTSTLIAHSERRQYFGESDESACKKVLTCQEQGIHPLLCIGESLEEREQNQTFQVIDRQLSSVLTRIKNPDDLVVAYEPVWAIGTGLAATAEQAQDVHDHIRKTFKAKFGASCSDKLRILYGGSMKPANTLELIEKPDIDGGLIGGASLKPEDFSAMILHAYGTKI